MTSDPDPSDLFRLRIDDIGKSESSRVTGEVKRS